MLIRYLIFLAIVGEKEFILYCVKFKVYLSRLIETFLTIHHIKTVHKSGAVFIA